MFSKEGVSQSFTNAGWVWCYYFPNEETEAQTREVISFNVTQPEYHQDKGGVLYPEREDQKSLREGRILGEGDRYPKRKGQRPRVGETET